MHTRGRRSRENRYSHRTITGGHEDAATKQQARGRRNNSRQSSGQRLLITRRREPLFLLFFLPTSIHRIAPALNPQLNSTRSACRLSEPSVCVAPAGPGRQIQKIDIAARGRCMVTCCCTPRETYAWGWNSSSQLGLGRRPAPAARTYASLRGLGDLEGKELELKEMRLCLFAR